MNPKRSQMIFRNLEPTPVPSSVSENTSYTLHTNYRGDITSIRVRRGPDLVEYERTNRRASRIFDEPSGELHSFFSSSRDFVSIFKDQSLLDIGCGDGGLVSDLRSLGLNAQGIDLHLKPEIERQKNFVKGDAFSLPFHSGRFDLLTSVYSVFHYEPLHRLRSLLAEGNRVLRPGGRILLAPIHPSPRLDFLKKLSMNEGLSFIQNPKTAAIQILKISVGK
jgi:SAM-dependent methyltransferase